MEMCRTGSRWALEPASLFSQQSVLAASLPLSSAMLSQSILNPALSLELTTAVHSIHQGVLSVLSLVRSTVHRLLVQVRSHGTSRRDDSDFLCQWYDAVRKIKDHWLFRFAKDCWGRLIRVAETISADSSTTI
jgi:hypothetical protein